MSSSWNGSFNKGSLLRILQKGLGPLYRHLKGKYGMRLDDQTPTLSFDFSGPFPVSATGARFMLLFVGDFWTSGYCGLLH